MTSLARLYINPQKRGGRRLLASPQAMHAAVRAAFPPDIDESASRVLWRVDRDQHAYTLYVVGPEAPDLDHVVEQAGWSTRPAEIADMDPFLDALTLGQEWEFRMVGNPVTSLPANGGRRGKVVPHVTAAQQVDWLVDKSAKHGFEILEHPAGGLDVIVDRREDLSFAKREGHDPGSRREVSIRTARFHGSLRVTDVEALRSALTCGIGRSRAYGCGLLSLARPSR